MKKIYFILIASTFLTTACGNTVGPRSERRLSSESEFGLENAAFGDGAYGAQSSMAYNCPSGPNVHPYAGSSSPEYTVCSNTQNASNIEIHGSLTSGATQICVFPANATSQTQATAFATQSGGVLYQCVTPTSAGAYAGFSVNYNAVFITEGAYAQAMVNCMKGQGSCNFPYSTGRFR